MSRGYADRDNSAGGDKRRSAELELGRLAGALWAEPYRTSPRAERLCAGHVTRCVVVSGGRRECTRHVDTNPSKQTTIQMNPETKRSFVEVLAAACATAKTLEPPRLREELVWSKQGDGRWMRARPKARPNRVVFPSARPSQGP